MIESLNFLAFQSDIVLPGIEEEKFSPDLKKKKRLRTFICSMA